LEGAWTTWGVLHDFVHRLVGAALALLLAAAVVIHCCVLRGE